MIESVLSTSYKKRKKEGEWPGFLRSGGGRGGWVCDAELIINIADVDRKCGWKQWSAAEPSGWRKLEPNGWIESSMEWMDLYVSMARANRCALFFFFDPSPSLASQRRQRVFPPTFFLAVFLLMPSAQIFLYVKSHS